MGFTASPCLAAGQKTVSPRRCDAALKGRRLPWLAISSAAWTPAPSRPPTRRCGRRSSRSWPRSRRARRGRARAVGEVRQVVAGLLQAQRQRDRARHRPGRQARPRGHQVRAGAGAQLRAEAARDLARPGGRDAAGRHPRPQAHPGELDRLLRAGRALSDGRLGAHVDRHGAGGRREAHHRLRAAAQGRAASGHRRRHALRRRRRDLRAGRRAGGRRHGARHRARSRRST